MTLTEEEIANVDRFLKEAGDQLTHTEYTILRTLLLYNGQLVTPQMLCKEIWNNDLYTQSFNKSLHVHMHNLRHKLAAKMVKVKICNIRNKGYYIESCTKENSGTN